MKIHDILQWIHFMHICIDPKLAKKQEKSTKIEEKYKILICFLELNTLWKFVFDVYLVAVNLRKINFFKTQSKEKNENFKEFFFVRGVLKNQHFFNFYACISVPKIDFVDSLVCGKHQKFLILMKFWSFLAYFGHFMLDVHMHKMNYAKKCGILEFFHDFSMIDHR